MWAMSFTVDRGSDGYKAADHHQGYVSKKWRR